MAKPINTIEFYVNDKNQSQIPTFNVLDKWTFNEGESSENNSQSFMSLLNLWGGLGGTFNLANGWFSSSYDYAGSTSSYMLLGPDSAFGNESKSISLKLQSIVQNTIKAGNGYNDTELTFVCEPNVEYFITLTSEINKTILFVNGKKISEMPVETTYFACSDSRLSVDDVTIYSDIFDETKAKALYDTRNGSSVLAEVLIDENGLNIGNIFKDDTYSEIYIKIKNISAVEFLILDILEGFAGKRIFSKSYFNSSTYLTSDGCFKIEIENCEVLPDGKLFLGNKIDENSEIELKLKITNIRKDYKILDIKNNFVLFKSYYVLSPVDSGGDNGVVDNGVGEPVDLNAIFENTYFKFLDGYGANGPKSLGKDDFLISVDENGTLDVTFSCDQDYNGDFFYVFAMKEAAIFSSDYRECRMNFSATSNTYSDSVPQPPVHGRSFYVSSVGEEVTDNKCCKNEWGNTYSTTATVTLIQDNQPVRTLMRVHFNGLS